MKESITRISSVLLLVLGMPALLTASSTGTVSQVVGQRNTMGVLTASPNGTVTAGNPVTLSYTLMTAGAPSPTSETVQFFDGATQIGAAQAIATSSAMNLLPYSQINTANGWTTQGTAPSIAAQSVSGADGSTNTGSAIIFMDSTSTVEYAVPGTTYAGQAVTFSIYAQSSVSTSINLTLQDNPFTTAEYAAPCAVSPQWTRCSITYTFPANAGTGFAVYLSTVAGFGVAINTWGAQVEKASAPGPYVSTIGTARPTGGAAGTASLVWNDFRTGTHNITAQYGGDTNFVASTSNVVTLTAIKETPSISFVDAPAGTSVYGAPVSLTATLADQDNSDGWIPTGTVTVYDGSTAIGTATVNASGQATITLSGAGSLLAGTHNLTAQYSGDSQFDSVTSAAIVHIVTRADSSLVVTTALASSLNPSSYGDAITLSVNVKSSVGIQPTGTVTIVDGSTTLGTVTLDGSGNGSLAIPLFTAGSHTITATYSGDSNYN